MLHAARWEQLLGMRDRIDQVQVLAWNDFGESIYLNDLRGDMPPEAKLYANKDCEYFSSHTTGDRARQRLTH